MSEVEKISGSHGGMYKDTTAFWDIVSWW
jgi:hypothetical protein